MTRKTITCSPTVIVPVRAVVEAFIHQGSEDWPPEVRVAVGVHDPETGLLHSFRVDPDDNETPEETLHRVFLLLGP